MTTWLAVLIGVVLGGALGEVGGAGAAAAGGVLAWLWLRQRAQAKDLAQWRQQLESLPDLRQRLAQLEAAAHLPAVTVAATPQAAVPDDDAAAEAPLADIASGPVLPPGLARDPARLAADDDDPWPPEQDLTPAESADRAASALQPGPFVTAPAAAPSAFDRFRAWLMAGNPIAKAGIAILFIGLAFLAKYASEHVHLPVELRLAGIAAAALVLLALGWRLRVGRPAYAQALQGGAVALLYLTLFAAFRYYGVLAAGPTFALMVGVAGLAAALAVLQQARALAVIGALGGFATPLLLASDQGNPVALFAYYGVLNLGIAAVAWHTTWRSLNLIGFAATFIVATAWGVLSYDDTRYTSSQAFLVAYFLLFDAILLMPARRRADRSDDAAASTVADRALAALDSRWVDGSLLFGLPVITFVLQVGLVHPRPYGVALSCLALAAFYVLQALALRRRPAYRVVFEASLAIGTIFLSLVIPFALDASQTAGAWALEGAGLVWLARRLGRREPRWLGCLLVLLAGVALAWAQGNAPPPSRVFNGWLLNALLVAAGSLAAAWFVRPALEGAPSAWVLVQGRRRVWAEALLIGWAMLWLLAAASLQIDRFVAAERQVTAWVAALGAIGALCAGLSRWRDWAMVARPAMALAPALALAVAVQAGSLAEPLAHGGWWAWPLALAAHAAVLRWAAGRWLPVEAHATHVLGVLVLAGLGALQGRALTAGWGDAASAWPWLGWLVLPALLLALLPRAATARWWPVSADPVAYQGTAGAGLALGLALWTLAANAVSNGQAAPLPHVPLANPLDLGVAAALLAITAWWRSAPGQAWLPRLGAGLRHAPLVMLSACGFVQLNAMMIRAFHHYDGVPYQVDSWMASLAVQTGLTLLWTSTALVLMWLATRRAWRMPWLAGAGLLAAVTLKLLLIDLSGSGTITRIVSFIGVGVLMLAIGYLAPLPHRRAGRAADTAADEPAQPAADVPPSPPPTGQ